jgi:hypothetical protein
MRAHACTRQAEAAPESCMRAHARRWCARRTGTRRTWSARSRACGGWWTRPSAWCWSRSTCACAACTRSCSTPRGAPFALMPARSLLGRAQDLTWAGVCQLLDCEDLIFVLVHMSCHAFAVVVLLVWTFSLLWADAALSPALGTGTLAAAYFEAVSSPAAAPSLPWLLCWDALRDSICQPLSARKGMSARL